MSARKSVTKKSTARRQCNFWRKAYKIKTGTARARKFMSECIAAVVDAKKPRKRRRKVKVKSKKSRRR